MKKFIVKGFVTTIVLFLCGFAPIVLSGQKNTVLVQDGKGTGVPGVTVLLFSDKTSKCICFMGGCLISPPAFDFAISDANGHAKFGEKGDPKLKPLTTYYASIDAKCTSSQQQCSADQDCTFRATFGDPPIKTDKKGNFDAVKIIKTN